MVTIGAHARSHRKQMRLAPSSLRDRSRAAEYLTKLTKRRLLKCALGEVPASKRVGAHRRPVDAGGNMLERKPRSPVLQTLDDFTHKVGPRWPSG